MQPSDTQIRALAATFACRRVERTEPTDDVRPHAPYLEWLEQLRAAREAGTLRPMVRAVAESRPDDGMVQAVCARVTGDPVDWSSVTAGAALLSAVAGLALLMGTGMVAVGVLAALEHPSGARLVGDAVQTFHDFDDFNDSAGRSATHDPATGEGGSAITADAITTGGAPPPTIAATGAAGDDRPAAAAPEGPPDMPMSRVRTRVPRVEDGPPEGPLEPPVVPSPERSSNEDDVALLDG